MVGENEPSVDIVCLIVQNIAMFFSDITDRIDTARQPSERTNHKLAGSDGLLGKDPATLVLNRLHVETKWSGHSLARVSLVLAKTLLEQLLLLLVVSRWNSKIENRPEQKNENEHAATASEMYARRK